MRPRAPGLDVLEPGISASLCRAGKIADSLHFLPTSTWVLSSLVRRHVQILDRTQVHNGDIIGMAYAD
jgi:hypothetical protein